MDARDRNGQLEICIMLL